MDCPACDHALAKAQLEHVAVHDCPNCAGIWFDGDELHRAESNADEWIGWIDVDVFGAAASTSRQSGKRCPTCHENLRTLAYPHSEVQIEACTSDHGVWLDKGEFDKVVKALVDLTNAMSAQELEHAAVHQLREIVGGNESHVQELRNFMTVFRLLEMRLGVEHPAAAQMVDRMSASGPL
jgi:Zn-finger nucleic acid-binding protein